MFAACPRDAQNRILTIVKTLTRLNSPGRKQAVSRVRELSELPRYRTRQHDGCVTETKKENRRSEDTDSLLSIPVKHK